MTWPQISAGTSNSNNERETQLSTRRPSLLCCSKLRKIPVSVNENHYSVMELGMEVLQLSRSIVISCW